MPFFKISPCFLLFCSLSASAEPLDYFSLSLEQLLTIKVNAASGVNEQLIETPTPVSVITEQMIHQSGAYTLRDLLTLYIPNFVQVQDQNEYNVAFRGVYTSAQQKFLILLDGHRLNSRAYSMASPDHSIALEKVKHIEVLRGPGSSVHGNNALTSVVNIVTKSGTDLSGVSIAAEVGDHGYREVFAEAGTNYQGTDLYAWFKYVESNGEKWQITPEQDYSPYPIERPVTSYLDGFFAEPSFDYGITVSTDSGWHFLANMRQSHYSEPLTTGGSSGAAFELNDIPLIDGVGPGAQSEWLHSYLSKSWQLNDNSEFNLKVYFDTNRTLGVITNKQQKLMFSTIEWNDKDIGFSSNWQYQFDNTTLLLGVDYDHMEVTDSKAYFGASGEVHGQIDFNGDDLLEMGSESIWSGYGQIKTQLNDTWLVNAGVRYDYKNRHTGSSIKEVSPRLALIRETDDNVVKFSYAQSFVDPPYWNRYSSLPSFRGSEDLKPEMLDSFQVSPEFYWLDKSLQVKLNLYYNKYSDVVFRRVTAEQDQALFTNAGHIESIGLEQEISYQFDNKILRFIGSHNRVIDALHYPATDDDIHNIPSVQFNLIFDHKFNEQFEYQLSMQYIGQRYSPINIALDGEPAVDKFPNSGVQLQAPNNELDASTLFNLNLNWQPENLPLSVSFSVKNLFDKDWYQGGSVAHPYKQTGRWFKFGLQYKF